MLKIPIFPLGTVLFEGLPLPLQIFEDRYLDMIEDCKKSRSNFGIVLIESGSEAHGPLPEPHNVGTLTRVAWSKQLPPPLGRPSRRPPGKRRPWMMTVIGRRRFEIKKLYHDEKPYLQADVELFAEPPVELLQQTGDDYLQLRQGMGEYLKVQNVKEAIPDMKNSNLWELANMAAALMHISWPAKQRLLKIKDCQQFINNVIFTLDREIRLSSALSRTPPPENPMNN